MAEIIQVVNGKNSRRFSSTHKLSTKVDLTPMVDLGFLLITFFMFSTKLAEPTSTKLLVPADGDSTSIGLSSSLTVVPISENKIFYYHGDLKSALNHGAFGITNYLQGGGIGKVIREKQLLMEDRKELMLIIMPSSLSNYGNIIDLLDEVQINGVSRYALVELHSSTKEAIATKVNL